MYRAGASLMLRVWPNDCEGLRHQIPQFGAGERIPARGRPLALIGVKLFITAGTAKVHLSNIYRKLGLSNRAQLTAQAITRSAIGQPDP